MSNKITSPGLAGRSRSNGANAATNIINGSGISGFKLQNHFPAVMLASNETKISVHALLKVPPLNFSQW